jgi:hypothetical protein
MHVIWTTEGWPDINKLDSRPPTLSIIILYLQYLHEPN